MKALLVDGEELFRISLREIVSISTNFLEIIEACSEQELQGSVAGHTDMALVIVHPNGLSGSGTSCIKLIQRLHPGAAIVILLDPQGQTAVPPGVVGVKRNVGIRQMISTVRGALGLPPLNGLDALAIGNCGQPATDNPLSRSGISFLGPDEELQQWQLQILSG